MMVMMMMIVHHHVGVVGAQYTNGQCYQYKQNDSTANREYNRGRPEPAVTTAASVIVAVQHAAGTISSGETNAIAAADGAAAVAAVAQAVRMANVGGAAGNDCIGRTEQAVIAQLNHQLFFEGARTAGDDAVAAAAAELCVRIAANSSRMICGIFMMYWLDLVKSIYCCSSTCFPEG